MVRVGIKSGAMEIKRVGLPAVGGAKTPRGECKGFSFRSRRRMMDLQTSLDWASVAEKSKNAPFGRGFFVTLTYADVWGDKEKIKRDLEAWKKRIFRALGPFSAVWKLELQERGFPHFHVTLFFKRRMAWVKVAKVCRDSWVDLVDSRVVDVQTIYARNGEYGKLMRYMSKYMGKPWSTWEAWGRVWGVWNSDELPMGPVTSGWMDRQGYVELCRRLRRWGKGSEYLKKSNISRNGMLIYGSQVQMEQLLRGLEWNGGVDLEDF